MQEKPDKLLMKKFTYLKWLVAQIDKRWDIIIKEYKQDLPSLETLASLNTACAHLEGIYLASEGQIRKNEKGTDTTPQIPLNRLTGIEKISPSMFG